MKKNYSICDLHCDTVHKIGEDGLYSIRGAHLDLKRMSETGYALQTLAAFVELSRTPSPWEKCLSLLDTLKKETAANADLCAPAFSGDDITKNIKNEKISLLLSVEEGGVIGDDISRIKTLYGLGVRMMTLTWNYANSLAHPAFDRQKRSSADTALLGLTPLGYEAVSEMEALGIIIDVSHLSDKGFYDLCEITRRPFIASHSNARSLCDVPRNLTDDMIKNIADRGGIIGLNFCTDFVGGDGGCADLARHARHIYDIGGINVLALGSDFDGIDTNPDIPDCTKITRLVPALEAVGFTPDEIDLIIGKNALRFLTENI